MSSSITTRTAYISRLRKAFLLRVHPDRFRTYPDETIRKKQAELVQAINARFELPDFIAYANNSPSKEMININDNNTHVFSLMKNDGTVLKNKLLKLDDTVDNIVQSIVDVIRTSGASSFPSPPKLSLNGGSKRIKEEEITQKEKQYYKNNKTATSIKYNIKSNQGKDLKYFLTKKLDVQQIQILKSQRLDASAAALVTRHAYRFQSIDGTRIGWSSLSSIKLFTSLLKLHDEFSSKNKFNVKSFYPLRLIFSYDEIDYPLCVYSGTLLLHPASTIIQWLDIFMNITQDDLDLITYHQNIALKNIQIIQNYLKIKIQKGFSCSGREYYLCLQYLADQLQGATTLSSSTTTTDYPLLRLDHYYITYPNMLKLIIESKYTYKTATIEKKTGNIHINSNISNVSTLLSSLNNLSNKAYDIALQQKHKHNEWMQFKEILQYKFQLSNIDKVSSIGSGIVTNDQIYDCFVRLSSECNNNNGDDENIFLNDSNVRKKLIGQTVQITSSGQFCHIADDGSIIIPWDWC